MLVEAFQTLEDRNNPDQVEESGPFPCNRANAWLGEGCYFWDSNIEWAHDWGNQYYMNSYIICNAKIILDNECLDLVGNIFHQIMFKKVIDEFINSNAVDEKKVSIAQIIELMKKRKLFNYSVIRANDNNKKLSISYRFQENREERTTLLRRTQICLLDITKLVLHSYRIIFPEEYVLDS